MKVQAAGAPSKVNVGQTPRKAAVETTRRRAGTRRQARVSFWPQAAGARFARRIVMWKMKEAGWIGERGSSMNAKIYETAFRIGAKFTGKPAFDQANKALDRTQKNAANINTRMRTVATSIGKVTAALGAAALAYKVLREAQELWAEGMKASREARDLQEKLGVAVRTQRQEIRHERQGDFRFGERHQQGHCQPGVRHRRFNGRCNEAAGKHEEHAAAAKLFAGVRKHCCKNPRGHARRGSVLPPRRKTLTSRHPSRQIAVVQAIGVDGCAGQGFQEVGRSRKARRASRTRNG